MKRWLRRILLMLILGVVTTVGVAWVCVIAAHRVSVDANGGAMFPPHEFVMHGWGGLDAQREVDRRWIERQPFEHSAEYPDWTDWRVEQRIGSGWRETR